MAGGQRVVEILDCTLRDGGYKTNWQFPADLIKEYLKSIKDTGIKYVEPGLRLLEKNDSYGDCAYSTDEFLESLNIPDELQIVIMIKAGELLACDDPEKTLDKLFLDSKNTRIDMIRVAVPYQNGTKCLHLIDLLKTKGYKTALNLTKTHPGCESEISTIAKEIQNWDSLDILYFADSFGELNPDEIKKFILAIKQVYNSPLGFHGHNNKGLAFANSLVAGKCGVDFIDSTVTGIGKGSGNLKTEEIIKEFPNFFEAEKLSDLVKSFSLFA